MNGKWRFPSTQRSVRCHSATVAKAALLGAILGLVVSASPAGAHEEAGIAGGLISGFLHPLFGPDHLIAMVAVGLWGAFLGPPALYALPVIFPLIMALGGALGIAGMPLPQVETGIALSAIVLGAAVAAALRLPIWASVLIVGIFAIFHGHAHGAELPEAADPVGYSAGFIISTGLLHLAGIAIGTISFHAAGRMVVRVLGSAIALGGVYFLLT